MAVEDHADVLLQKQDVLLDQELEDDLVQRVAGHVEVALFEADVQIAVGHVEVAHHFAEEHEAQLELLHHDVVSQQVGLVRCGNTLPKRNSVSEEDH